MINDDTSKAACLYVHRSENTHMEWGSLKIPDFGFVLSLNAAREQQLKSEYNISVQNKDFVVAAMH